MEDIPFPERTRLLYADGVEVHGSRNDDGHQDADGPRDLVADHLGRFAHAAEEGPLAARAVAAEDNAEDLAGHDRQHVEDRYVHVLGDDSIAEGQGHKRQEGTGQRDVGPETEEDVIRIVGDNVFLDEELEAVGEGLQPAELAPDARGPESILDAGGNFALQPDKIDRGEKHERDQDHGRDQGDD